MSSIFDIDKIITRDWLVNEGWIKTMSFTEERNPWWTKIFKGLTSNGATRDINFAYNDETNELIHMKGFPYPKIDVETVCDVEVFISSQLKNYRPIQYLNETYLIEK